ncbi:MAG: hypothetical protein ABSH08_07705 [Tepidisphaeraceae bacterium]|jgi:hypothetical protein
MRRAVLGALAVIGLQFWACDKRPQTESASPSHPTEAAYSGPSTRDVSVEPRKSLSLLSVPLILSVPQSWKLEPRQNPAFLEGAAPSGDLHIAVSMLDFMNDHSRQVFVDRALDQSRQHPGRIQIRQLTASSGMQILQRITYVGLPNDPPGQSPLATRPSQLLSWRITIFVPYRQKFIPCNFDLSNLTQQQYLEDEQFIQSIMETARQDAVPAFQ